MSDSKDNSAGGSEGEVRFSRLLRECLEANCLCRDSRASTKDKIDAILEVSSHISRYIFLKSGSGELDSRRLAALDLAYRCVENSYKYTLERKWARE